MSSKKRAEMSREEELQHIAEFVERVGVYRAALGECSAQDSMARFRQYKKKTTTSKKPHKPKFGARYAAALSLREKDHASSGGLLNV